MVNDWSRTDKLAGAGSRSGNWTGVDNAARVSQSYGSDAGGTGAADSGNEGKDVRAEGSSSDGAEANEQTTERNSGGSGACTNDAEKIGG